ncbi:hypothetical protein SAMN05660350_04990 [Geodermatophilus obscurus]|uniref:Uncharacterized protein n=1 Tax=Geodermatophilus obscurus TaxID=1861 RepID=A0A1M7V1A9_9ACTN|nr:hypothetical protein [Geodermatophilus obscurus]SHN88998.1 hypothetical protein SAMN05660350_04990 [Geodermatophilus obscurus]
MTQRPRTAVFLARAWWEEGQFRARITYCLDIQAGPAAETRIVTADPAEARQHLATWLDQFTTAASS